MSLFPRRNPYVSYTCPGCNAWQLDAPTETPEIAAMVSDALTEHRRECPPMAEIYTRAVARAADKEVPVAPVLPTDETVSELEAEIIALGRRARRAGHAHRQYVEWHERINELLTWRDEALAAAKVAPVEFSE